MMSGPPPSPAARHSRGMVYDAASRSIVRSIRTDITPDAVVVIAAVAKLSTAPPQVCSIR